ncbi:MAG: NADPH-dependent F420 reductase [Firmicutes bacterium]|nr:NADPH-dependent F420 reductase [Bacillota bacterium]
MRVGIIGGTGSLGQALALRLIKAGYQVELGSRDKGKAVSAVESLQAKLRKNGIGAENLRAGSNQEAAELAQCVIITIPYLTDVTLLENLKGQLQGKVVVDCTVGLDPNNITEVRKDHVPSALRLQEVMGSGVRVIAAFHTVAAAKLSELDYGLKEDTFVAGEDGEAKDFVIKLAEDVGLRAFDVGGLRAAGTLERLTAMLVGLNKRYRRRGISIKLTGV